MNSLCAVGTGRGQSRQRTRDAFDADIERLSGELPPELGHLEELEELLLAGNPELNGCVSTVLRDRLKRHTGVEWCDPTQQQSVPDFIRDERGASVDREALGGASQRDRRGETGYATGLGRAYRSGRQELAERSASR